IRLVDPVRADPVRYFGAPATDILSSGVRRLRTAGRTTEWTLKMPVSVAIYRWLPPEAAKIVLVLFLSFLIGLEREERKAADQEYLFGGIRTFPFIGLIGYAMAFLSGSQWLTVTLGFAVVAGFLMLSYRHKLAVSAQAGVTTEMCGLITYLIGALVFHEQYWIAATLGVASALLLELKATLDSLAKRITLEEI